MLIICYDQCQSSTTSTVVKAPLVRASLVKRRYIKYLALPGFFHCALVLRMKCSYNNAHFTDNKWLMDKISDVEYEEPNVDWMESEDG